MEFHLLARLNSRTHLQVKRLTLALGAPLICAMIACGSQTSDTKDDYAVDECIRVHKMVFTLSAPMEGRAAILAKGCAPLFHRESCRRVMLELDRIPKDEVTATLMTACKNAYCPDLPRPLPQLCRQSKPGTPLENGSHWAELRDAIYRFDLGEQRAMRLKRETEKIAREYMPHPVSIPLELPEVPGDIAPTLGFELSLRNVNGIRFANLYSTGRAVESALLWFEEKRAPTDPFDFQTMATKLAVIPTQCRVSINPDQDTAHKDIIDAIHALKQAGITKFYVNRPPKAARPDSIP